MADDCCKLSGKRITCSTSRPLPTSDTQILKTFNQMVKAVKTIMVPTTDAFVLLNQLTRSKVCVGRVFANAPMTFSSFFFSKVSSEAAQQRQTLQMLQLFPCLFRLGLAADPPVCTRHQKRQGLLLQHVRPGVHLSESDPSCPPVCYTVMSLSSGMYTFCFSLALCRRRIS